MRLPDFQVQVAWATDPNGPNAATPAWQDIGSNGANRVRSVTAARSSRAYELDQFQTGTCNLSLLNWDGAFTPLNSASPFYPNVTPYRPVRVLASYAGVTYPIWQGYVERWPATWADPVQGISSPTCVDVMGPLASIDLPPVYVGEVQLDNPTLYYPLAEPSGAAGGGNASATIQPPALIKATKYGAGTSTYAFGASLPVQGTAATTQSGSTINSAGGTTSGPTGLGITQAGSGRSLALTLPSVTIDPSNFMVELWVANIGGTAASYLWFGTLASGGFVSLSVGSDRTIHGQISPTSSPQVGLQFPANMDTGLHHLVFGISAGKITVGIDGSVTTGASVSTQPVQQLVGNQWMSDNNASFPQSGTIGHVALYPTVLTNARILAHYQAGNAGAAGETSTARIARLLRLAGWPAALEQLGAGSTAMGPSVDNASTKVLGALQSVADTELGQVYATADGKIAFDGRNARLSQLAPTVTFGPNTAAGQIPFLLNGLQFDYDPTRVFADVQVTRTLGITAQAVNPATAVGYFPRGVNRTMNGNSDQEAVDQATFLLDRYSQPALRLPKLIIDAGAMGDIAAQSWPALLALTVNQRVRVVHDPLGQPPITLDGYVEGVTHNITPQGWTVDVQVSPALRSYWLLAAMWMPLSTAATAGATSIGIGAFSDAATIAVQSRIRNGDRLTILDAANTETVTVVGQPSTGTPWTTATVSVSALAFAHAAGVTVSEPLPAGVTDPSTWDSASTLDVSTRLSY